MRLLLIASIALLIAAPAQASQRDALVELTTRHAGPSRQDVVVQNKVPGPVQVRVRLAAGSNNVAPDVALPGTWVLPASQTARLFGLSSINPSRQASYSLGLEVVPGAPGARHADYPYIWPIQGQIGRLDQGFGGSATHQDRQNHYAIDIVAPEGTPIIAARPGTVMVVEDGYWKSGLDRALMSQANQVRVLHDDGSMAVYVHIQHRSSQVRAGQRVEQGQPIARLGGVGFASGPHLHFVVQVNTGMDLQSVRFKMFQPRGAAARLSSP